MIRLIRMLPVILLSMAVLATGRLQAWEYIQRDGVKYVTMTSVRSFYGFTSQKREGKNWLYEAGSKSRVEKVRLTVRPGSQDLFANGLRFVMSYPVVEDPTKGMLISAMDVNKILHPILMPNYIQSGRRVDTVIIDPGHGGHDAGAKNRVSLEKDLNLIVGKKLREALKKRGFRVVMTRETDVYLTLQQRVTIANRYQNAVFISVHFNSGRPAASGLEVFTLAPAGTSSAMSRTVRKDPMAGNFHDSANIALASAVQTRMLRTKLEDRGIKRARFSVLCTIKHPAILVECGFMSNAKEAELIRTDQYHNFVAAAIADGVAAYKGALNRGRGTAAVATSNRAAVPAGKRH